METIKLTRQQVELLNLDEEDRIRFSAAKEVHIVLSGAVWWFGLHEDGLGASSVSEEPKRLPVAPEEN